MQPKNWIENRKDIAQAGWILLSTYIQATIFGPDQNELILTGGIQLRIRKSTEALSNAANLQANPKLVKLAQKLIQYIPSSCVPIKTPAGIISACDLNPISADLTNLRIQMIEYLDNQKIEIKYSKACGSLTRKSLGIILAIKYLEQNSRLIEEYQTL